MKLFDVVATDERDVVVPRIARAVRDAAAVQHPNVVASYEFGVHRGKQPYALSELVSGRSLAHLLDAYAASGQRLQPDLALVLGIEIAEALAEAHACRLLHGDLSARATSSSPGTGR